jgi:hypothetical protein
MRMKVPWLEFEAAKEKWVIAKDELGKCKAGGLLRTCTRPTYEHSRSKPVMVWYRSECLFSIALQPLGGYWEHAFVIGPSVCSQ